MVVRRRKATGMAQDLPYQDDAENRKSGGNRMTVSAKQYSGNPLQWLRSWLSQERTGNVRQPVADYAGLALELSACRNEQELMPLLASLQQRLRQIFFDCSEADSALLLPLSSSEQDGNLQLLSNSGLSPALQQTLLSQAQQAGRRISAGQPAATLRLANGSAQGAALLLPLNCAGHSGWLLLNFRGLHPTSERVSQLTSALRQALTQGLGIYLRHRQAVQQAVRDERAAQAAELHDSLAQVLGYLRMRTARLQSLCHSELCVNGQPVQEYADDLATQTLLAYRQVRELISTSRLRLREETLDHAIAAAIAEMEQHSAIVFELDNRCPQLQLSQPQLLQLSYIVRESLTNIVRHSYASHARIRLSQRHNQLRLRIEDNGRGIHPDEARADSFGLKIMHERAQRIGARLAIAPRTQGGTCVELTLADSK